MASTGYPFSSVGARQSRAWSSLRLAILLGSCLALAPQLWSQAGENVRFFGVGSGPDTVRGTVINGSTHEPIARALVHTSDKRYAALTDDQGHFEFKFPPQEKSGPPPSASPSDPESMRKVQQWYARNARPDSLMARRPGFLQANGTRIPQNGGERAEITITLEPEARIVGHVQFPGVDNTDRVQLLLYRQDFEEGHERWVQAGHFTTWASGEFRFSELAAGTYKLFTEEQTEQDSAIFNPGDQLYGFPPVFFSNAGDFSAATPIKLAIGATFQANLTLTMREYYPVKIRIANPPAGGYPTVDVFLRAHPGPGYSLGYNPSEEVVQGFLPDGAYTLKVFTHEQEGSSGTMNFIVRGGPVDGQGLTLYPNLSLSVNLTPEFNSGGVAPGDGTAGSRTAGTGGFVGDPRGYATIMLSPAEQFGMHRPLMAQPLPSDSEGGWTLSDVAAGTYWMQISTNNCYAASATWGGRDVLRHPLTVGTEGPGTPIEVTLRNDGAEVLGKVQITESGNSQNASEGPVGGPFGFVYFVPLEENAGQLRKTLLWQNGTFDEQQIAPGTYRILAFDHQHAELGPANAELLRKYESKGVGVLVDLSPKQTLRLPAPLVLVSEP